MFILLWLACTPSPQPEAEAPPPPAPTAPSGPPPGEAWQLDHLTTLTVQLLHRSNLVWAWDDGDRRPEVEELGAFEPSLLNFDAFQSGEQALRLTGFDPAWVQEPATAAFNDLRQAAPIVVPASNPTAQAFLPLARAVDELQLQQRGWLPALAEATAADPAAGALLRRHQGLTCGAAPCPSLAGLPAAAPEVLPAGFTAERCGEIPAATDLTGARWTETGPGTWSTLRGGQLLLNAVSLARQRLPDDADDWLQEALRAVPAAMGKPDWDYLAKALRKRDPERPQVLQFGPFGPPVGACGRTREVGLVLGELASELTPLVLWMLPSVGDFEREMMDRFPGVYQARERRPPTPLVIDAWILAGAARPPLGLPDRLPTPGPEDLVGPIIPLAGDSHPFRYQLASAREAQHLCAPPPLTPVDRREAAVLAATLYGFAPGIGPGPNWPVRSAVAPWAETAEELRQRISLLDWAATLPADRFSSKLLVEAILLQELRWSLEQLGRGSAKALAGEAWLTTLEKHGALRWQAEAPAGPFRGCWQLAQGDDLKTALDAAADQVNTDLLPNQPAPPWVAEAGPGRLETARKVELARRFLATPDWSLHFTVLP